MQNNCAKNPLICAIIPFVFGIISGQYILSFNITLFISIICLSLYLVFKTRKIATFLLFAILFFSGMLRYQQSVEMLPAKHVNRFKTDEIKSIIGTIRNSRYSANGRHQYTVNCDSVYLDKKWIMARGKILLKTKKIKQKYSYGMRLRIQGPLRLPPNERNPGQFNYRQYLAQNDISRIIQISSADSIVILQMNAGSWFQSQIILPIKRYCQGVFNAHLDFSSVAVMNALILGEKQDIDRRTIENFQQVGVVHVLAISGLHVGYVIIFVFTFLSFLHLSQNFRTIMLAGVLLIYIILVDFKPPVMRASLMALFYLWGRLIERKISTGNLLAAAAFIILLFEPRELYNPGFQFSFAAVISIIYGYQKMNDILPGKMWFKDFKIIKNIVWNPLLVSLSAVIGTLPLTLFYYGTIPLIAVAANLIVIPIIGLIVFLGFFLLLLHPVSINLGDGIGMIIQLIFKMLKGMTDILSEIPFASLDLPIPDLLLTIIISAGIGLLFFLKSDNMIRVLPVYTAVLGSYILIHSIPDSPAIEVTFIDVGQGDAAFIQFPNKSTMLIDAGDATQNWDNGKATVIPYLKQQGTTKINYLVGSHPHDDHIGGFHSIIEKLSIDTVVFSAYPYQSKNYQRFLEKCNARRIPIRIVGRGDQLYPDSTARVYILHPDSGHIAYQNGSGGECNNSSLVMKIQYGQNGILFTGDLEVEAEPVLFPYKDFLECELVKIAHHGSKTSSSQSFLNFIQPLVAVIPVAAKNKFKHPSPGTVDRLRRQQIQTYFTSRDGAVVFKIGAQKIRKINWR
jgi:competence protein ComEC